MELLVVEDDPRMARLLYQGLTEEGHRVTLVDDGPAALGTAQSYAFDAIVLDVMIPGLDGLAVARRLRDARNQTPLLMLTARDSESDIVRALDLGADDYLTKPFSFDVLLARIRAVARRGPIPHSVSLACGDLTLDPATRAVQRAGRPIPLTPREFGLLELLLRNAGRVVTRETILNKVWGYDTEVNENTVEAFVRLLRNKIELSGQPKVLQTVRGIGYCIRL